jgi:hypothetical protein
MKILSLESLEKIGKYLDENSNCIELVHDFDAMTEMLGLQFIDTEYDIDIDKLVLTQPNDDFDEKQSDAKNCEFIYSAMKNLSPAEATDDRLWVTLCFIQFNPYVLSRWKLAGNARGKIIKNHWTFQGSKPLTRDNALSRLWWMGHIASQIDGWSSQDVFEILFNNSDYRQSLVDRSGSTSNIKVVSAILSITKFAFAKNIEFKRAPFRRFMEEVNFISGRSNLSALALTDIINILQPIYLEVHGVDRGNPLRKLMEGLGSVLKK